MTAFNSPSPATRADDARLPSDHLHQLLREAVRDDGLDRVLRLLSTWFDGRAALIERNGQVRAAYPAVSAAAPMPITDDVVRVADGLAPATSTTSDDTAVCVLPIHEGKPGAIAVVTSTPLNSQARLLVSDAVRLVALRQDVTAAAEREALLRAAQASIRESVLHLLMVRNHSGARRAAAALGPSLPDTLRVYVVQCHGVTRNEAVRRCDEAYQGRAWIVRCPVFRPDVIVLAPVDHDTSSNMSDHGPAVEPDGLRRWVAQTKGVYMGASRPVSLRDVATGYTQSRHALALARKTSDHYASFSPRGTLADYLDSRAIGWASRLLQPLTDYRPHRRQDPDAQELTATLTSWFSFASGAAAQLKIHRNTLSSRLRLLQGLLGLDIQTIAAQAQLSLAMQVLDRPGSPGPDDGTVELDTLLRSPDVSTWAHMQLAPLLQPGREALITTVRVWLDNETRLTDTADTLGLSAQGTRKRLLRAEEVLERFLLSRPSSHTDIWLALRARDLAPTTSA